MRYILAMTDTQKESDPTKVGYIGELIRGIHPYHFRSEVWAKITGYIYFNGADCYSVEFEDGNKDYWVITDSSQNYEFKDANTN